MNNTRKELINILYEHMDKTQVEWLLITTKIWWHYFLINDRKNIPAWDIIGHYDITAVLKYIEKHWWFHFEWRDNTKIICFGQWNENIQDYDIIWDIEYKPLHLYTEQEEESLLELLKKLKN